MVNVNGLSKQYKVAKRKKGGFAALRSLFHREYTTVNALEDVSFHIAPGEIAAYIGPNGAGKSTTIKILSGILHPDAGDCTCGGYTPWKARRRYVRHIGVVFGQRTQLWWDVPVIDSYELLRDIYAIPQSTYASTLDRLTQALDIGPLLSTPLRQLSLGQRMRCELAASLLHGPSLLFLDEPTIGLDAVSKLAVRAFIRDLQKEKGTTVLLTTHDMQDIEALTDRLLLIGKGRLLYDGTLSGIRDRYDDTRTLTASFAPCDTLPTLAGAQLLSAQVDRAVWRMPSGDVPRAIATLNAHLSLSDVGSQGAGTEDIVARLYADYKI